PAPVGVPELGDQGQVREPVQQLLEIGRFLGPRVERLGELDQDGAEPARLQQRRHGAPEAALLLIGVRRAVGFPGTSGPFGTSGFQGTAGPAVEAGPGGAGALRGALHTRAAVRVALALDGGAPDLARGAFTPTLGGPDLASGVFVLTRGAFVIARGAFVIARGAFVILRADASHDSRVGERAG